MGVRSIAAQELSRQPKIVRTIELYTQQYDFIACTDRFTAFIAGIGSGKTFAGAMKAIYAIAQLGGTGLVVAPTYAMLRDATLRTFLEFTSDMRLDFRKSDMTAAFPGGVEIFFRSADTPDRLRGTNISWAWIDEASLCPPGTWEIVIGRLREGGRAGPCWITSTPKGRNWLYRRIDQITVFRASTWDNPYLDKEFVRSLEQSYSGAFARQELHGEFVTFEGLVYEEFDRSVHVTERAGPWRQVIAGVDEGYTNPAVILVVGVDGDGRAHVIQEFYRRRVLQGEVVERAAEWMGEYSIASFYVDPSAAGLIAEMIQHGLPVVPADNRVKDGIQELKARLRVAGDGKPRLTLTPSAVNTIAEFESYAWKQGRDGLKDEPEKVADHAMDALRYALTGMREQGPLAALI